MIKETFHVQRQGDRSVGEGDTEATITVEENMKEKGPLWVNSWKEILAEWYDLPVSNVYTEEEQKELDKTEQEWIEKMDKEYIIERL